MNLSRFYFALVGLLISSTVISQAAPADLARTQADTLQREQASGASQQRPTAPSGTEPLAPERALRPEGAACVSIEMVTVRGVKLLKPKEVDAAIKPFTDTCLGLADINNVLEALTFRYVEKGYITARAYLPEQDLGDGSLEVVVIEGELEAISMNGDAKGSAGHRNTAFPGMIGHPVNLREIEQGLDQMSRLQSVNATMQVSAGSEQGKSVLQVNRTSKRPWSASFYMDNLGSASTGKYQSRLSFGYDDLFGLNDQWNFSIQRSMNNSPIAYSAKRPHGTTLTFSGSIPLGRWTFSSNLNVNEYKSSVPAALGPINTSGSSKTISLSADYLLHRDQVSKTNFTTTLTHKDNKSFILGALIQASSRKLTILNFNLSHARQLWGGNATASLGFSKGLKWWGAFDDAIAPVGSPEGQFEKFDASLGFTKKFPFGSLKGRYDGKITAQWSNGLLFGSEQISIGGRSSVRGSESAILFGNNGIYLRNEFSLGLPKPKAPWASKLFGEFEAYFALDIGRIIPQSQYSIAGGNVSGASVGLRTSGGRMKLDVSYSDLLSVPAALAAQKDKAGVFAATMTIVF